MLEMTPCIQQTYQEGCSGSEVGNTFQTNKRKRTSKTIYVPHKNKPANIVSRRNARERRRVQAVNNAFKILRNYIPYENRNKRLSKVKTLQKAIDYIHHLQGMIAELDAIHVGQNSLMMKGQSQARILSHDSDPPVPEYPGSQGSGYFQGIQDKPDCAFYGTELVNASNSYWNNTQGNTHLY